MLFVSALAMIAPPSPASAATFPTSTLAPGGQTNCAIRTGGAAYCWGSNQYGQLGNGGTANSNSPTPVTGGYVWQQLSSEDDSYTGNDMGTTCGVTTSGAGYCWGNNYYGENGNGTATEDNVPAAISGGYTWKSLSVGWADVCGVATNGNGYCWGANGDGEDGNGTTSDEITPVVVSGGYTWASITAGNLFTCGVTTSGAGYCWGGNWDGQLGNNSTTNQSTPTAINGGYTWSSVAEGSADTCGVTTSGAGYCWGDNEYGEVGDNSTTEINVPTAVNGGYTWSSIDMGNLEACGLTTSGVGYCWGSNWGGQVGDGTTTNRSVPTVISGGYTWSTIATGDDNSTDTNCGLTTTGTEYCWGYNNSSQVGDGTTTNRSVPTTVSWSWSAVSSQAVQVTGGTDGDCALTSSGMAYCWGIDWDNELGDGGYDVGSTTPIAVDTSLSFTQISEGGGTVCGLTSSGAAYCWGYGDDGEIGNGAYSDSGPALVSGSYTFKQISVAANAACGLTTAGAAYCWGGNWDGQLGNNSTSDSNIPVAVSGSYTFTQITAGGEEACGLTSSGGAYCWGDDYSGQLGNNSYTPSDVPVAVSGGLTFSSLVASQGWSTCGITTSNATYCWGDNAYGGLGNNSTTNSAVPVSVNGGYSFASIVGGQYHTCGLTAAGSAYCWGDDYDGQLGNGSTTESNVPSAVSGGYTFASLGIGYMQTCGVLTGSQHLYCWGDNAYGGLGNIPHALYETSPTTVQGGQTFTHLADGGGFACGLTSSGSAYCWGYGQDGELGDGKYADESTPAAVSGGYTFSAITAGNDFACGLQASTGNIYCWGNNSYGQLGNNGTNANGTPVEEYNGWTWTAISAGSEHMCALRSTGNVYCWGDNSHGQLGNNSTTSSDVAVESGTNTYSGLGAGGWQTCAIKSSNSYLYCWGDDYDGELGVNSTTDKDTPTHVNDTRAYSSVSGGDGFTCALTTAGAAYCFGYGSNGQMGNGTWNQINKSPVAVSGSYTFSKLVTAGQTACGISAGAAYCWGYGYEGETGNGTIGFYGTPVAVSDSYTWSTLGTGAESGGFCGEASSVDYCWGLDGVGQVGDWGSSMVSTTPVEAWFHAATISSVAQYNGASSISNGSWVNSSSITFKATTSDADSNDLVALCVEVEPNSTSFTNNYTQCGSGVSPGSTASVTVSGLSSNTQYHWQAIGLDEYDFTQWTSHGGSPDFGVDTTPPTNGTVYDGSTTGVETTYNNGSLSQLSCNWAGFSDAASGLASYDYSVGSTLGGTDISGWTNVGTSTTSVNLSGLNLHTSQTYYCNVRAHDNVGNVSSAVSSPGQLVAPTLTFSVSPNSVNFSALGPGNSYTNSQNLTLSTSTNAYNGYNIYAYETGPMTAGSNTIPDYSAPATAPTTWSGTGFGYTVSGGAAASGFSSGTKYARFGTQASPDTVASHTSLVSGTPITNEQETVTAKVTTSANQAAGTYTTSVAYSCIAIF